MPNRLYTTEKNQNLNDFRVNANEVAQLVVNSITSEEFLSGSGFLHGWNISVSGGTADQPQYIIWTKGDNKVRLELTWGTSGGAIGNVTRCIVSYSEDNGFSWTIHKGTDEDGAGFLTNGHFTITYDADGYFVSGVWS